MRNFDIGKRGQSALEYLMTYGWALVVIVIVVAALFLLGILNPATYQGSTCTGFTKMAYKGHSQDGNSFTVRFQNATGASVSDVNSSITASDVLGTCTGTQDADMTPGEEENLACTTSLSPAAGSSYSATVQVTYTARSLPITETGTCTGTTA